MSKPHQFLNIRPILSSLAHQFHFNKPNSSLVRHIIPVKVVVHIRNPIKKDLGIQLTIKSGCFSFMFLKFAPAKSFWSLFIGWRGQTWGPLSLTLSVVSRPLVFFKSCSTLSIWVINLSRSLVRLSSADFTSGVGSWEWYCVSLRVVMQQGVWMQDVRQCKKNETKNDQRNTN